MLKMVDPRGLCQFPAGPNPTRALETIVSSLQVLTSHGAPLSEVCFVLDVTTVTSDAKCLINAYFIYLFISQTLFCPFEIYLLKEIISKFTKHESHFKI